MATKPAAAARIRDKDEPRPNIGMSAANRKAVAAMLAPMLGTNQVLAAKVLAYHWNVTGPQFRSLHLMFEEQYRDLAAAGDEIAERIRALGFPAPGTLAEMLKLSSIEEDRKPPPDAATMVANLVKAHEAASREARAVLDVADDNEDEVTEDIMIQRMKVHDKAAWMLRALADA